MFHALATYKMMQEITHGLVRLTRINGEPTWKLTTTAEAGMTRLDEVCEKWEYLPKGEARELADNLGLLFIDDETTDFYKIPSCYSFPHKDEYFQFGTSSTG